MRYMILHYTILTYMIAFLMAGVSIRLRVRPVSKARDFLRDHNQYMVSINVIMYSIV